MIYLSSDWHLCHDKEFVWKARGFNSIDEMNRAIVERHNSLVKEEDDVYVLGDLMLNDNVKGIELFKQMKGKFHIICGNHDTPSRIELYKQLPQVVEVCYATIIKKGRHSFYLSHYPTLTSNMGECHNPTNLFGHTHQENPFDSTLSKNYNVGVDAHDCYPVSLEKIIEELYEYFSSKEEI